MLLEGTMDFIIIIIIIIIIIDVNWGIYWNVILPVKHIAISEP
jgi:hypothetical protein